MKTSGPCTKWTKIACRTAEAAKTPTSAAGIAAGECVRAATGVSVAVSSGESASPSSLDLPVHAPKCGVEGGGTAPPSEGSVLVVLGRREAPHRRPPR